MSIANDRQTPKPAAPVGKRGRLSLLENLILYSQYILIALLVLAAAILRLTYGAP